MALKKMLRKGRKVFVCVYVCVCVCVRGKGINLPVIGLLLVGGVAAADPVVGHRHFVNIFHVAAEVLERGAANLAQRHAHLLRVIREILLAVPALGSAHSSSGQLWRRVMLLRVVMLRLWLLRQPIDLLLLRGRVVGLGTRQQRRRSQVVAKDGGTAHRHR